MSINLVSKSAYARHRGVDEKAVRKAVAEGRISLINGKIDPAVADIQWAANTRVRAGSGTDLLTQATAVQTDARPVTAPVSPAAAVLESYTAARARREAAEAERAELGLAEEKGELIRVEAVKSVLGVLFASTRDALLQIPARMAALLAAESAPAAVQTLLYTEIHQALQQLATAKLVCPPPERLAAGEIRHNPGHFQS